MNSVEKHFRGRSETDPQVVTNFLAGREFPLVEDRGVTFVYRGEADSVLLQHWIYGLPSAQPLQRLGSSDLWHLYLQLPARSRVEYKFEVVRGQEREWIMDPLNPRLARDPFGANSVCYGKGYRRPNWTLPDPEAREGDLKKLSIRSNALGGVRQFKLYLPARYRKTRRYPLLVVHDGEDFLNYAQLKTVLDNLIHRLEVAPLLAALIRPGDRLREYGADPRHAQFVSQELVPYLERKYPLYGAPAARGLMGASFGAVASLFTAWENPGFFGNLLLQSGSFTFSEIGGHHRGPEFDSVVEFVNRFRADPGQPASKVFLSCGVFEPLIYENRSLVPLLQETGMEVRYTEARDGHNWENWRDRCRDALSWLFPGPLWFVYE